MDLVLHVELVHTLGLTQRYFAVAKDQDRGGHHRILTVPLEGPPQLAKSLPRFRHREFTSGSAHHRPPQHLLPGFDLDP